MKAIVLLFVLCMIAAVAGVLAKVLYVAMFGTVT